MRNLHFKYARADNFLCFKHIEVDFQAHGPIVLIRGQNLDVADDKSNNGSGKCFGISTPILMHNGTIKRVQDVKAGDLVMGNDSRPRKVLSLHSGREMLFDVIPTKGVKYTVNGSHILALRSRGRIKNSRLVKGYYENISVENYFKESAGFRRQMGGYCAGVDFPNKDVLIDPYFLGVWLGDGKFLYRWKKRVAQWIAAGNKLPLIPLYQPTNKKVGNILTADLLKYNLINNKHIPHDYKANSREVRLQLLAGLLDKDGRMKDNCYDFVNQKKTLAEDVLYLARSLGLAASIKACRTGTYWKVHISGACDEIPVRIPYKKVSPRTINEDPLAVGIKVEAAGVGDYYGFTVDGNPLFLLGDFTVVHNSSLAELPTYALYGKTIKKPNKITHGDVINHQIGKKLEVEFIWDKYRVIRGRKPDSLRLWESEDGDWCADTEITVGGMPATQKEIEKRLGLNYETFVNLIVFSDDNSGSFLECDTPTKREIIENLLSLEKYRGYFENSKLLVKEAKDKIKALGKEYERYSIEMDICKSRVFRIEQQAKDWKKARTEELNALITAAKNKKAELSKSDDGAALHAYKEAQERIAELTLTVAPLESKRAKLSAGISDLSPKYDLLIKSFEGFQQQQKTAAGKIREAGDKIAENEKIVRETQAGGELCPYCEGRVDEVKQAGIVAKAQAALLEQKAVQTLLLPVHHDLTQKVEKGRGSLDKFQAGLSDAKSKLEAVNKLLTETHGKISNYAKVKEPKAGVDELLLQEQLEALKKQVGEKKAEAEGPGPFVEIKLAANKELDDKRAEGERKKAEVVEAEGLLPYYDFWVKAFGDTGIRKYIIQGILPALNSRIAYWLQFLADNKISLTLDSELKETVDRVPFKGRPYVYYGLSNGQRRRLILALSQALAHIQMLNAGASPSVVWLDEVTINLDEAGVEGAYRMICELAKEKQVFVIDHNEALLQALDGCDTIYLQMKNEVTSRVENFD